MFELNPEYGHELVRKAVAETKRLVVVLVKSRASRNRGVGGRYTRRAER